MYDFVMVYNSRDFGWEAKLALLASKVSICAGASALSNIHVVDICSRLCIK